ncbi:MAG: hypothetical protein WBF39_17230, partial [Planococcus donghaensis]
MKTEQQNVNERRHERLGARTAFAMVALGRSEQSAIPNFGVRDLTTDQRMQIKANRASSDGDTPATIEQSILLYNGEFDPGSGRTLAACLI